MSSKDSDASFNGSITMNAWPAMILVCALLGGILYPITKFMTASGEIDYCYVKLDEHFTRTGELKSYVLVQHVRWASNRTAGSFKTFDEAVAASKEIGCELR